MREYGFSLTRILPYKDRFGPYTGEHGLVKTRILAYFMKCNWYFLERFSELSYHFFSNSKDKVLDDFAFHLHFEIVWLLPLQLQELQVCLLCYHLFSFIRYIFPKNGLIFMRHAVTKNKYGKGVIQSNFHNKKFSSYFGYNDS